MNIKKKRKTRNPIDRFMEKISTSEDGCWIWSAGMSFKTGYGYFSFNSKPTLAHRWSYETFVGRIPDGMQIDHLCKNRRCVNPKHLEPVTSGENTRRGDLFILRSWLSQSTNHCKRGHEFSSENTIINSHGHRGCKICQRMKADEWRRKNRKRVNELQNIRYAMKKGAQNEAL